LNTILIKIFFLSLFFLFRFHSSPDTSGQIQSAVKSLAGPEGDGPARRGLPVLQAHAGQRAYTDPSHGDASRKETIKRFGINDKSKA
jgi:hypothetical protein